MIQPTVTFDALVTAIEKRASENTTIIGISGFCGAGKTTLAAKLQAQLKNATHIEGDSFIINKLDHLSDDWDSIDRVRIIEQVITPIYKRQKIRYQLYDWNKNAASKWREILLPQYVILEGIGIIHPDLLPYFNYIIWVDCSQADAMSQGLDRHHIELGYAHDDIWNKILIPNDHAYFQKHHPRAKAHFIYKP